MGIRWMIRRDMPMVLDIEQQCHEFPWTEEDFMNVLRERNCIGVVAEETEVLPDGKTVDKVIGFVIYDLRPDMLFLTNIAVHPKHQCQGVGTKMIDHLKHKLNVQRRVALGTLSKETNLPAQLFFKKNGFKCIGIEKQAWNHEDAYEFRFSIIEPKYTNRISDIFKEIM